MYKAFKYFSIVFTLILGACSSLSRTPPPLSQECPEVGVVRELADIELHQGDGKRSLDMQARLRVQDHLCYMDDGDIRMKMVVRHDVLVGPQYRQDRAPVLRFFIAVMAKDGSVVTRQDESFEFNPTSDTRQAVVDEFDIFIPKKEGVIPSQVLLGFLKQ